ncbi:MAG: hypothetical protein HY260_08195 [Chloroflexi bacterium]|nr:hypothetical protein [Chloroflexota bacterium]
METYRLQKTGSRKIKLERGNGELEPAQLKPTYAQLPEDIEPLSRILQDLNERFGTNFTEQDRVFIEQLEAKLAEDAALDASVRVNTPDNARLTFDHVVNDRVQELIDTNFKFYKQITDDDDFAQAFFNWLFERYLQQRRGGSQSEAGTAFT